MSMDKIIAEILAEASAEAQVFLKEAEDKKTSILAAAEEQKAGILSAASKAGEEEKLSIIRRRKSVAEIDARKRILAKKQDILQEGFDKVVEALISMEEGEYVNLLAEMGVKSGLKGGSLVFNQKEKDSIGKKVVEKLNASIEGGVFELSEKMGNLKGGYLIEGKNIIIDNTMEALVEEQKKKLTAEAAKLLFPVEG